MTTTMKRLTRTVAPLLAAALLLQVQTVFAEDAKNAKSETPLALLERLQAKVDAQEAQIAHLQELIDRYDRLAKNSAPLPMLMPVAPVAAVSPKSEPAPLSLRLGNAYLTPIGFLDFTSITRSTNVGSGIGTNFGSVPFGDSASGRLRETRFSGQNSRIGLRVDTNVKDAQVMGYLEADFLGFVPTNAAVSSNSDTLRLRQYWVDVRQGKWEILGGQAWSMLTPNRNGISPLPTDIFFTQNLDTNYQAGLVWSRDPQFRTVYHASRKLTLGVSLEASEQYIGGSSGGGVVTLPAALSSSYASELNVGTNTLNVPNSRPDVIAKVAYDDKFLGRAFHVEAAGVSSSFAVYNAGVKQDFRATGQGVSVNLSAEPVKNVRLISTNFYGAGVGRYIFGQAPDLVVRADGSLSPVHSESTVSGMEVTAGRTQFSAYYGGVYIDRNVAVDQGGKLVGYGFAGSANSQNRAIQEITFGVNRTLWKDPAYGAFNVMAQYSYVFRNPWFVAPGGLSQAVSNMVFVNVRYTLPGAPPSRSAK
jgi:hypothetical protein